ncbi:MAG: VCBS repeat-containing protein [Ignavibacteriales bacterium]|nr:VCBS repeat-containing protein [Ignavibacteriales bacterium]
MNHIDEKILELYAMNAEQVQSKRDEIGQHLKVCAGCSALYDELKEYYSEVEPLLNENFEEKALIVSSRINLPELIQRQSILTRLENLFPLPVIRFVRYHPVASSISLSGLVIALLLLVLPKFSSRDVNPDYARAKDEYLVTYNKHGEKLWDKHIGVGYDIRNLEILYTNSENYLATYDVDNDGKKEIITIFGYIKNINKENQLICYNSDGNEKWKYEFHRSIKYGEEAFTDSYKISSFIVGDYDKDGKSEIIAVAQHTLYYPTAIVRLDAETGKLLNEYWHTGHINQNITHKDFNNDGVEEIFCFGENNGLNLAPLLILDPRNINGHSPSTKEFIPENTSVGTEMYYILFPRSDLNILDGRKRNYCTELEFTSDGFLRVAVSEKRDVSDPKIDYCLYYFFDNKMNCVKVGDDDKFTALHQKLEAEGKLTKKLDKQYYEDLRKNVLYWDGEKFAKEPNMNKNYLQTKSRLTQSINEPALKR